MQFDHEMFNGFPVSIPVTVFMAEIKVIPQPLLIIIMKGMWNRFLIQQQTILANKATVIFNMNIYPNSCYHLHCVANELEFYLR